MTVTDFPYAKKHAASEWPALFDATLRRLRHHLRARLGNAQDAEDLAQETLLRVWTHRDDAQIRDPEGFVFKVANNLVTDRYRHRARWQMEDESHLPDADEAPSAERRLAAREELLLVRRAIESLPPRDRRAFELHLDGLSAAAIAAELSLTRRRVEQILVTSLRALHKARAAADGAMP